MSSLDKHSLYNLGMKTGIDEYKLDNIHCVNSSKLKDDIPYINLVVTNMLFGIDFGANIGNYTRNTSKVLEVYNEIPKERY